VTRRGATKHITVIKVYTKINDRHTIQQNKPVDAGQISKDLNIC
jgi:hypothetical protein